MRSDADRVAVADPAERAFAQSASTYRQLVELSPDGMLIERGGRIVFVNTACVRLFGAATADQLIGRPVVDFIPAEYHESARTRMRELHEHEPRSAVGDKCIRLDGSLVDVEVTVSPFIHEGTRAAHVILRNLTGRGHAQEKIDETQRQLEEARNALAGIVEHANQAIISRTLDGVILSWNTGAERMFGYSANEAIGRPIAFIVPPGQISPTVPNIAHILRGEVLPPRESQRLTKDGRLLDVLVSHSPLKDRAGNIVGTSVILQDISALKRAERAAKESEERFHAAFEQAGVAMALGDIHPTEPRWIRVNQKLCDLLGYTNAELLALNTLYLTPTEDRAAATDYNERLARGDITTYTREKRLLRKNGEIIWVNMTRSLVTGADGRAGYIISVVHDVTEKKQAGERLAYLAQYDSLTGLPNRSLFRDRLAHALTRAKRSGTLLALMFLDLDRFKEINDTLGHTVGDEVLRAVAARVSEARRESDTVARLGGDEFTVILENIKTAEQAGALAQKILRSLSPPLLIQGREIFVTASIGITLYPAGGDDVDSLLQSTDVAMYRAKEEGRNTYEFYDSEMNAHAAESMEMENLLRRALERGEFVLHFQPKVSVATGRITGAEALIRWNSPELGLVSPAKFVPLAEKTGLIASIGEWVLTTACRQNKAWQDSGYQPLIVSVNLSQRQFRQKTLVETVAAALQATGLDPRFLELEITESMIMSHADKTVTVLRRLHALGIQLSIDDFGTGYSSLAYLRRFPVQKLKVDKSFVQDLSTRNEENGIVTAVVAMAKSLGLQVVAEGVETAQQLEWLARVQCDEYQGYYFSRPLDAAAFAALLQTHCATGIAD